MRDLKVEKLCDEFGQYLILLTCECGHFRRCNPSTLAAFAGWDTWLKDIVQQVTFRRIKCTQVARKCAPTIRLAGCTLTAQHSGRNTEMLILTRRIGDAVSVGELVTVTVLGVSGTQVRLGFDAPSDVRVVGKERADRAFPNPCTP